MDVGLVRVQGVAEGRSSDAPKVYFVYVQASPVSRVCV